MTGKDEKQTGAAEKAPQTGSIIWKDRKRLWCGLPWTFTKYRLDEERLYITRGFFRTTDDEVRLYRITDVSAERTLLQKIFRIGTIHCKSADNTLRDFDIINVRKPREVMRMLSDLIQKSRARNHVYLGEALSSRPGMGGHDQSMGGGQGQFPDDMPQDNYADLNADGIPDQFEIE